LNYGAERSLSLTQEIVTLRSPVLAVFAPRRTGCEWRHVSEIGVEYAQAIVAAL
jgi:hypothetical protein